MSDLKINTAEVAALNALCDIVNQWAVSKGWNEGEDSVMRKSSDIALMHSELSECLEFVRKKAELFCIQCGSQKLDKEHDYFICNDCLRKQFQPRSVPAPDDHVPSLTGESAELADVLIRIFHYCGRRGIDLGNAVRLKHDYNITRPYKHGKNL